MIVSNNYLDQRVNGTDHILTAGEWSESMRQIVDKFRGSTEKLVFLAPPPGVVLISECYGKRGSTPADCIGRVTGKWLETAQAEQDLAKSIGGTWVDSRPWFCSSGGVCPSFAGSTPTKLDKTHMVPAYGLKIHPVIDESFREAGVF